MTTPSITEHIQVGTTWMGIKIRQDFLVLLCLSILTLMVTLATYPYSYDDAYITYRYSYNVATGSGFVYTPGEKHLGTTAPLYALLLGILGIPAPDAIPLISGWLSGLALLATSAAIYIYARRHGQPLVGLLSTLPFIFNPIVLETFGGEVLAQAALIMWAFVMYDAKRYGSAGFLLSLATLMRGDGIIPLGVIGLHYLITQRRIPWRMGLIFAAPLLLWAAFSYSQYRSFLPDTLSAKVAQSESGHWWSFHYGLYYVARLYLGPDLLIGPGAQPAFRIYVILGIPGLIAILLRSRYWLLPLAWATLHMIGYTLLRVPFYHWYFTPFFLAGGVMVGAALGAIPALAERLTFVKNTSILRGAALLLVVGILAAPILTGARLALGNGLAIQQPYPAEPYKAIGEWFARSTPTNTSIGYLEVGYIGYYSRRQIVDPLGLVTAGTSQHIRQGDIAWAYREVNPDYIVANPPFSALLGPYMQEPWFQSCYTRVVTIQKIDIFQRCSSIAPENRVVLERTQPVNVTDAKEILPGRTVGQTFLARQNGLRSVALLLAVYGKKLQGTLVFHLQRADQIGTGTDIFSTTINIPEIEENAWRIISFPPITDSKDQHYYFYLEAPQSTTGQAMTAWMLNRDGYVGGEMMVQHQPTVADLTFLLYYTK